MYTGDYHAASLLLNFCDFLIRFIWYLYLLPDFPDRPLHKVVESKVESSSVAEGLVGELVEFFGGGICPGDSGDITAQLLIDVWLLPCDPPGGQVHDSVSELSGHQSHDPQYSNDHPALFEEFL